MECAENGVNAITTGEEAFYPWNSSYNTTQLLDDLAKRNGCTLCGSGYQDVLWGNLITTLAGASHTIKKIWLALFPAGTQGQTADATMPSSTASPI